MNRYGAMAKKHWEQWLPTRYSQIADPDSFFSSLGEEIAQEVDELSWSLAGDDPAGEGFLEKVGRLNMARFEAEAQILREMALIEPEEGVESDEKRE